MKLFDLDGPLFSAMSTLGNIIVVNIIFCICCIPVVTIGAASTALHECMQGLLEGKDDKKLIRRFLGIFIKKFRQSTIIWFICLIILGMLYLYYVVVNSMSGNLGQSYQIVFYILCIVFLFGFQYFFPMLARYDGKVGFILKNSWVISVLALPWTLASVLTTGILIYVSFLMNTDAFGTAVYIWFVAGFGVVAYINNIFFMKAFDKIMPLKEING